MLAQFVMEEKDHAGACKAWGRVNFSARTAERYPTMAVAVALVAGGGPYYQERGSSIHSHP
jgi:hypothetical protein